MADFNKAIKFVLKNEGGYSDHPVDEGGPTNWGITMQTLSHWRKATCSAEDVMNLSSTEAIEICREEYWNRLMLNMADDDVIATILFDSGVNRGIGTAVIDIQRALRIHADGMMGPQTIRAINFMTPRIGLSMEFIKLAQRAYIKIVQAKPAQLVFLNGWILRTQRYLDLLW